MKLSSKTKELNYIYAKFDYSILLYYSLMLSEGFEVRCGFDIEMFSKLLKVY